MNYEDLRTSKESV